ncbi:DUF4166 domain-containing protein [Williamsia sp. M5A3_1d]
MTPVYRAALGSEFTKLHPNIQWRYGVDSTSGVAQVTSGIVESVFCTSKLTPPVLRFFRRRNVMPTTTSRHVPFFMDNYCYVDERGRESLAVIRRFAYSNGEQRLHSLLVNGSSGLVDYFGDGPFLLIPLNPRVGPGGSLILESEPMRMLSRGLRMGMRGLFATSMRYVEEWDDDAQRFRLDATVRNVTLGEIMHFRGWFTASDRPCTIHDIPDEAWPLRLEETE